MNIEDLVRAAQERQAERAVPADLVRAALPARIVRARRRRRLGSVGAAVLAVVVAVAIPVAVLRERDADRPRPVALALMGDLPVYYTLGWLPPGYAEYVRGADAGSTDRNDAPTVQRVWRPGDRFGGPELQLHVRTPLADPAATIDHSGHAVDINGLRGWFLPDRSDRRTSVAWAVDKHTQLEVTATNQSMSEKDLLRVARSVVPQPGSFASPVRLRWLPAGWDVSHFAVSGAPSTGWRTLVMAGLPAPPRPRPTSTDFDDFDRHMREWRNTPSAGLSVVVDSTTTAPDGGARLTVAGRPARHAVRPGQSSIFLVVDLGAGRLMTVTGDGPGLEFADLKTVAEMVEISSAGPDWIGR